MFPEIIARVEPLDNADAAAIAALEKDCFTLPWPEEYIRASLASQVYQILGVKKVGAGGHEELLAYISFFQVLEDMEIVNIAVRPDKRRQGLGRALLYTAVSESKSQGAARILLEVRKSNTPALALYREFGFQPIGLRKAYYRDNNEDALVLELRL